MVSVLYKGHLSTEHWYMSFTCLLVYIYLYVDQRDGDSKEIGGAFSVRASHQERTTYLRGTIVL